MGCSKHTIACLTHTERHFSTAHSASQLPLVEFTSVLSLTFLSALLLFYFFTWASHVFHALPLVLHLCQKLRIGTYFFVSLSNIKPKRSWGFKGNVCDMGAGRPWGFILWFFPGTSLTAGKGGGDGNPAIGPSRERQEQCYAPTMELKPIRLRECLTQEQSVTRL